MYLICYGTRPELLKLIPLINKMKENNLNVKETYSFPDHHEYSKADFDIITKNKNTKIITTEKDFYRINEKQRQACDYIEVKLRIDNIDKFKELINSYL